MESRVWLEEAFSRRPDRFRLLEKGLKLVSWDKGRTLLEVGCSAGDAASFLAFKKGYSVTAIDISREWICRAKEKYSISRFEKDRLRFLYADAAAMPFEAECFYGIYSEAAFAPMEQKEAALSEYYRVLRPGGRILLNDFILRSNDKKEMLKSTMSHIPCFAGVRTAAQYGEMFRDAGFQKVYFNEEYGELIRIALWLRKVLEKEPAAFKGKDFLLKTAELSYCQMIYEKI